MSFCLSFPADICLLSFTNRPCLLLLRQILAVDNSLYSQNGKSVNILAMIWRIKRNPLYHLEKLDEINLYVFINTLFKLMRNESILTQSTARMLVTVLPLIPASREVIIRQKCVACSCIISVTHSHILEQAPRSSVQANINYVT